MSSPLGQFLLLFMTSQLGHPDLVRIGLGQKVQTQQKRPEQQTGFCVQAFSIKLKIALFQAQHFVGLSCDFSQGLCKVQAKDADLTTGDIAACLWDVPFCMTVNVNQVIRHVYLHHAVHRPSTSSQ